MPKGNAKALKNVKKSIKVEGEERLAQLEQQEQVMLEIVSEVYEEEKRNFVCKSLLSELVCDANINVVSEEKDTLVEKVKQLQEEREGVESVKQGVAMGPVSDSKGMEE